MTKRNTFMEAALKARAESDARSPITWVVTGFLDGQPAEFERTAMIGYQAADSVKAELGRRFRMTSYVEKSVVEMNKETNRLNNITEVYYR